MIALNWTSKMSDAIIFVETLYLVGSMGLANMPCIYKGMLHLML